MRKTFSDFYFKNKDKSIVWLSQIARGIKNILAYAHNGIRDWLEIETREKYKQLELKL